MSKKTVSELDRCPHCGGRSGVTWRDYGVVLVRSNDWGGGTDTISTEVETTRPAAVFGKCDDCGKQVRLRSDIG